MSEHIQKTIADLQQRIGTQEDEIKHTKRVINDLCVMAGMPALYGDAELNTRSTPTTFRSDQFYGRPLAACVREYLEGRKVANLGPATVYEIFDALKAGGYAFEGSEEMARRGMAISISKNTSMFHRLPNDKIGLLAWYPTAKKPRTEAGAPKSDGEPAEGSPGNGEPQ